MANLLLQNPVNMSYFLPRGEAAGTLPQKPRNLRVSPEGLSQRRNLFGFPKEGVYKSLGFPLLGSKRGVFQSVSFRFWVSGVRQVRLTKTKMTDPTNLCVTRTGAFVGSGFGV